MTTDDLIILFYSSTTIGVLTGLIPLFLGYKYHIKDLAWFGMILCVGTGLLFGGFVSGFFGILMGIIIYLEHKKKSGL